MLEVRYSAKLPALQVLRAVAAGLVVFYHVAGYFEESGARQSFIISSGLGNLGVCGVDVFFVISGFIMVYTTAQKAGAMDAWIFMKRRVLRIFPLYWCLTTVLLVLWLLGLTLRGFHYSIPYLISSYLLLPYFENGRFSPLLGQGWTLSFEMLFYGIFSVAIFLKFNRWLMLVFLLAMFGALNFLGYTFPLQSGLRYLFTDPIVVEFVYGVLIGIVLLRLPIIQNNSLRALLPLVLICTGSIALLFTTRVPAALSMRSIYYGIPALLIVFGAAMLGARPCTRSLVYLGDASYSIYLVHFTLMAVLFLPLKHFHLFGAVPDLTILPATAALIVVSSFVYSLIERPLTRRISLISR